jgi:hypothetical protein
MFQIRAKRNLCGPKMGAVVGGWIKSLSYELCVFFSLPGDVREMKPIAVPWAALSLWS